MPWIEPQPAPPHWPQFSLQQTFTPSSTPGMPLEHKDGADKNNQAVLRGTIGNNMRVGREGKTKSMQSRTCLIEGMRRGNLWECDRLIAMSSDTPRDGVLFSLKVAHALTCTPREQRFARLPTRPRCMHHKRRKNAIFLSSLCAAWTKHHVKPRFSTLSEIRDSPYGAGVPGTMVGAGVIPSIMQGASPHITPAASMVEGQQSAPPLVPGIAPQPTPPHCPHSSLQHILPSW